MVQVMIRLQNHGWKNHPYWWIVVQPKNKCLKGRVLEKVGLWIPRKTHTVDRAVIFNKYKLRYWLSVGATPTQKVHHLLTMIDFLPKKPLPFGSMHKIERKPRTYKLEYFHHHRWAFNDKEAQRGYFYGKIKELEALMNRQIDIEQSAINEMIKPEEINLKYNKKQTKYDEEMNTDDINSDEGEFFSRKKNFEIISKKLDIYMKEKFILFKGNDLKYNNYIRKIEKLSMKQSLDIEGYKDYIENLKNLSESKNKTLQNIAKIYLKDLVERENFSEIIKDLKLTEKLDLNLLDIDKLNSTAHTDSDNIIKNLSLGFSSIIDNIFTLNDTQKEKIKTDETYKDLSNLRIAKMIIKLKVQIQQLKNLLNSEDYLKEENLDLFPFLNSEKVEKLESKLKAFEDDLLSSEVNIKPNEYEDNLFEKINNYLMNTETLKKYSNYFISDYNLNLQDQENSEGKKKSNNFLENIFSIDTELIDKIMIILIDKLSKSYELNEMFSDEIQDLAEFEKQEITRFTKRINMKNQIFLLKKKYGDDINILFDDFKSANPELQNDIREFKKIYQDDIESELDIKFKEVFKFLVDKRPKIMHKYDDPQEFENDQKYIEKFEEIKNKIMKEIREKQNGTYIKPEEIKVEENEEYFKLEYTMKYALERKFLGILPVHGPLLPKFDDDDVPDLLNQLEIPKKVFKGHKIPNEDEKKMINRRIKRFYDVINYSKTESTVIPLEKVELVKVRFLELFGRYNDVIYPDGFRHLESFDMYNSLYPLNDMSQYSSELREHCDFKKFIEIVFGAINQIKKIILLGFEFPELHKKLNYLPVYLHTKRPEFIVSLKEIYKKNLQMCEKRNQTFSVITALEYISSFKLIDSILPEITPKLENDNIKKMIELISTDRYTSMKLHDFDRPKNKDLGLTRQGPFMPINPLKAHRANPYINAPSHKLNANFPYKMKSRGFCTKI